MIPGHVLKVRWFVTRFPEADQVIHGMCKASGIRPGQVNGDFNPKTELFTSSFGCRGLAVTNIVNFCLGTGISLVKMCPAIFVVHQHQYTDGLGPLSLCGSWGLCGSTCHGPLLQPFWNNSATWFVWGCFHHDAASKSIGGIPESYSWTVVAGATIV